jgi:hypothetical protein
MLIDMDSPVKFSKAAILFVSESYINNKNLLAEKYSIVDKKIEDSEGYQIIPILIGIDQEGLNNHFQQLPSDYLNSVNYHSYDTDPVTTYIKSILAIT